MIFKCERCGIEHDCNTREGLIQTIAHIHYEMRTGYDMTGSSEGDMRYATGVMEWFEGKWNEGFDYFEELMADDCQKFEKYYRAYTEACLDRPKSENKPPA